MFGAVLTLPGIAGVILTIGMGVDSNVLVFERIREELRNGKSSSAAVDAGFDKAFLTIIDTHVRPSYRPFSSSFLDGSDSRVCHHLDDRSDRQRLHGNLRIQDDFPVPPEQDGPSGGTEHLGQKVLVLL